MLGCEVSVIMPAYNGSRYLRVAIDSVLKQTFPHWELVVVDDGSTDNTAEVVSEFAKSVGRIKYIHQANAGQANARNTGIKNSRGAFIAFLDQDDAWLANKLELQINAINDSGADVVFSSGFIFQDDDINSESSTFETIHGKFAGDEMFRLLFMENRIPVLTAIVRSGAMKSAGLLNEDPELQNSDDYELWLRLAANGAVFVGLPDQLARYRMHATQASTDIAKMLSAELAVLKCHEKSSLVSESERAERFSSVYQKLILALVDDGRVEEARARMRELLSRQGRKPSLMMRAALLKCLPGSYRTVVDLFERGQASWSYRIGQPLQQALGVRIARHSN